MTDVKFKEVRRPRNSLGGLRPGGLTSESLGTEHDRYAKITK